MAESDYKRVTVNFKNSLKDHLRAWEILNSFENKTKAIVKALLALDENQSHSETALSQTEVIRQIVREEIAKENKHGTAKQEASLNRSSADKEDPIQPEDEPLTQDIDEDTTAQILNGLDIFRK